MPALGLIPIAICGAVMQVMEAVTQETNMGGFGRISVDRLLQMEDHIATF
jgi:hypothetical protein